MSNNVETDPLYRINDALTGLNGDLGLGLTDEDLNDLTHDIAQRAGLEGDPNAIYVYDPEEDRCWGPFDLDADAADAFIASDKYLESWAVSRHGPRGTIYPPSEYHGRWPL